LKIAREKEKEREREKEKRKKCEEKYERILSIFSHGKNGSLKHNY